MNNVTKQGTQATEVQADEHKHPTWSTYWKIALILTILTAVEVFLYETSFRESRLFIPILLILSLAKFVIVVMYYMHLKFDHKIFRTLFVGSSVLATIILTALLFLFGQISIGG